MPDVNTRNIQNVARTVTGASINTFQNILNDLYKKFKLDEKANELNKEELIARKIIAEASKNAYLPVKAVPNSRYNLFMRECKAKGIETATLSMANDKKEYKYVAYHLADKELMDQIVEKVERTYEREVEISLDDMYKYNLRKNAIKIPDKDELWLERFKIYASKEGVTFAKEAREDGKYDIHISAGQINAYNKASFQTEWDLNGRFAQVYKEKDIQSILKREHYMERINRVPEEGAVIVFSKNRDDYTVIEKDRAVVYVSRQKAKEISILDKTDFREHIGNLLKHPEEITLLKMSDSLNNMKILRKELEKEDLKYAIAIPSNFEKELETDRAIKNIVMHQKNFSRKSSFNRDEIVKAKENLLSAYVNAQNKIEVANVVIGEVNNKGRDIDFVAQAKIAIGNLEQVSIQCEKDSEIRMPYEIDETLIRAEDLDIAREFAKEREARARIIDLEKELSKDDISLDERRELQREYDVTLDEINKEANLTNPDIGAASDGIENDIDLEKEIDEDLEEEIEIDIDSGLDDMLDPDW